MAKIIKVYYQLDYQHLTIKFYKFKDLISYIKLYPKALIVRYITNKNQESTSVILARGRIHLFHFTNTQNKKLMSLFTDKVDNCKYHILSKYQERKINRKTTDSFNKLNYFQQQSLIKSKANFRRRCDSSFYSDLEPLELYIEKYTNYLKSKEGIKFKSNPIL